VKYRSGRDVKKKRPAVHGRPKENEARGRSPLQAAEKSKKDPGENAAGKPTKEEMEAGLHRWWGGTRTRTLSSPKGLGRGARKNQSISQQRVLKKEKCPVPIKKRGTYNVSEEEYQFWPKTYTLEKGGANGSKKHKQRKKKKRKKEKTKKPKRKKKKKKPPNTEKQTKKTKTKGNKPPTPNHSGGLTR